MGWASCSQPWPVQHPCAFGDCVASLDGAGVECSCHQGFKGSYFRTAGEAPPCTVPIRATQFLLLAMLVASGVGIMYVFIFAGRVPKRSRTRKEKKMALRASFKVISAALSLVFPFLGAVSELISRDYVHSNPFFHSLLFVVVYFVTMTTVQANTFQNSQKLLRAAEKLRLADTSLVKAVSTKPETVSWRPSNFRFDSVRVVRYLTNGAMFIMFSSACFGLAQYLIILKNETKVWFWQLALFAYALGCLLTWLSLVQINQLLTPMVTFAEGNTYQAQDGVGQQYSKALLYSCRSQVGTIRMFKKIYACIAIFALCLLSIPILFSLVELFFIGVTIASNTSFSISVHRYLMRKRKKNEARAALSSYHQSQTRVVSVRTR